MDSPAISIYMPMYNASRYLRECIDSVLAQTFTDFEFLIADDGSTDNSVEIVESYFDTRIRLIKREHNYIATLNALISEAKGKYLAKMDADDIMTPNRISDQFSFMENNKEVDIMFGGIALISEDEKPLGQTFCTDSGFITIDDLTEGCNLAHPTAFIRRTSISSKSYMLYNPNFVYAEDYSLWVDLLIAGLKIFNSAQIFGYYRRHEQQVSITKYSEQQQKSKIIRKRAIAYQAFRIQNEFCQRCDISDSSNKLTVVIPFLNEHDEVKHTVESIRSTTGDAVDIIVINDNSSQDYDYIADLQNLNITYIANKYRIGAARSKEKGVNMVRTPYFLILDAHMRFYKMDWHKDIVSELEANPNRLLCCQTLALNKNKDGIISEMPNIKTAYGAYISYDTNAYIPGIKWNNTDFNDATDKPISIPCVLGAGYASSKCYWDKIAGMQGLQHYGCEEVYISIKAWLEGGGCYLLPNLIIGHIYRDKFPYRVHSSQYIYNYLFIADTLLPTSEQCMAHAIAWKLNKQAYFKTLDRLCQSGDEILLLKSYFSSWHAREYKELKQWCLSCANTDNIGVAISEKDANYVISVLAKMTPNCSIASNMAIVICLLSYLKQNNVSVDIERYIETLWQKISLEISHCADFSFTHGLSGMGWLLIFAAEHGLIDDDISRELEQIDKQICFSSPIRITDLTLLSGVGGIYAYVMARLGYAKRVKFPVRFSDSFISELHQHIPFVLQNTSDWRTFNFALQLSKSKSSDCLFLPQELMEVVDVLQTIPTNTKYWDYTLSGILGSTINYYVTNK